MQPSHASPSPPYPSVIAAVASGWGRSPRAIIRLSGPGTNELCNRLFDPSPIAGGQMALARFRLTDTLLLPCLLIRSDAPRSYTGEDAAEMVVPGNPALLERITARLCAEPGVREAGPGEFSARAYLSGRITLDQAEGVAALIAAQNDQQLAAAKSLMEGQTGSTYRAWTEEVATLLALVEAGIDFTDQEDVVPISPASLAARLSRLTSAIRGTLGAAAGAEQLSALPRVVLVGRPNAGKSTLFNALLGRRRAITSPVAGTTRDAIVETLDLAPAVPCGSAVQLVDLAGLDAATSGEVDRQAQARAQEEIVRADILLLCDAAGRFDLPAPGRPNRPIIRVRTKADLPLATSDGNDAIGVCALDGWQLGVLRRAIADAAWAASGSGSPGAAWLLPRHRRSLAAACERLDAAHHAANVLGAAHALDHPELIAGDLRAALDELGELVGHISPDDVIGRVFATFCVGK